MPVSVSPKPSDGAVSSKQPFDITVTTGSYAMLFAFITLPDGTMVRLEARTLIAGKNKVRIFFPPGIPPGSKLSLNVRELMPPGSTGFTYTMT